MAHGISREECTEAFDHVWDVDWSRNPLDLKNVFSVPTTVRQVVELGAYDLVHVHTPVAAFVARFALRGISCRPKVFYTAHGFHFYPGGPAIRNWIFSRLEKLAGRWTDYLVVINPTDEEQARQLHIVPDDRVCLIPGSGIDTEYFSPDSVPEADVEAIRRELGLGKEDPLLTMIAEFNPGKRHSDALRAFAQSGCTTAHLAFAGIGPLLQSVKRLAVGLGVIDRVHFLGYRRDVRALIRASLATILPSEREGLSRVVTESMSLGVPVIGSNVRGIRELLASDSALVVPLGDIAGLAGAIEWVVCNPAAAHELGKRARRRAAAYDLQLVLRSHEALYERALAERVVKWDAASAWR